jgi:predicted GIY-YIG superfamily endonuclease
MQHFLYILQCADDSLDIGTTTDIGHRVNQHNAGRGGRFTACRRPVVLLHCEVYESAKEAVARERQIKRWTRAKKLALVTNNQLALTDLARRRNP